MLQEPSKRSDEEVYLAKLLQNKDSSSILYVSKRSATTSLVRPSSRRTSGVLSFAELR